MMTSKKTKPKTKKKTTIANPITKSQGQLPWLFVFVLFISLSLAGCNNHPSVISPTIFTATSTPTISPPLLDLLTSPTNPPQPIIQPTGTDIPKSYNSRSQYQIQAWLDYPDGQLTIHQELSFTNLTGEEIPYLALNAEPNRYPETLSVISIELNGVPLSDYNLNQNILIIPLSLPLQPLSDTHLVLNYNLQLPQMHSDLGNGLFGRSQWQTNLLDWYFWLPPYSPGKGWLIHLPAGFAEHTVYPLADFEVSLTVLNPPENLVVTGSTTPILQDQSYHFSHPSARNLFISLSPYFQVLEQIDPDVTVRSYFFPGHQPAASKVLNSAYQALITYGKIISPYRHPVLNIVETNLVDGLEGDGMFFLGSSFYDNLATTRGLLTLLTVHETAHQWWYAAVSNDQALEPWLDEAFCTFMESLYYENISISDLEWWEVYRLTNNPSVVAVDSPVYDFSFFRPYRDAVYLRGAGFLLELRAAMGDEKFFAFLQDYFHRASEVSISSAEVFFATLSNYYEINQSNLLDRFFLPTQPVY